MTSITKAILVAAAAATLSFGQVSKSQGYVFQGFTAQGFDSSGIVGHTGGGGEGVFWRGISAGGDISAAYPFQCLSCVIGVGNINGGFHYNAGRVDKKWEPFVTAGYSLFFRGGTANGFNYGGGVVYWFKPHVGLRLEVRDHWIERYHMFTQFRIGLSFR
jgi:hypothetical protein